jgi:putative hydrolase of the HAD superfamily
VKAVFFDAGGTLVHIDYPRVAHLIRETLGRDVPVDGWIAAEYAGRAAVEAGMVNGDLPTDTSRWSVHFEAMLGALGITADEFTRVGPAVMAAHKEKHLWSGVFSGTADALASLKPAGYMVGLISNADGAVDRLLRSVGLAEYMSFMVDSGKVGVEKPDRRIFDIAMEEAARVLRRRQAVDSQLTAADCYYVGDIYSIDVVGSRAAGMVPVLLDPLGRYGDRDCKTIRDVPTFARELVSARRAA